MTAVCAKCQVGALELGKSLGCGRLLLPGVALQVILLRTRPQQDDKWEYGLGAVLCRNMPFSSASVVNGEIDGKEASQIQN